MEVATAERLTEPPELLLALNKKYREHHEKQAVFAEQYSEDPIHAQVSVAFTKYILPAVKKAATAGQPIATLTNFQIKLEFIQANLQAFEKECQSHGLQLKLITDDKWLTDLKSITLSGWAEAAATPVEKSKAKKESTLTERTISLEKRVEQLDAEIQQLKANKP